MVTGGPARRIPKNSAMLEGPRADRYAPDNPAYWCRDEAPQPAEGHFTRVRGNQLAPPPVRQVVSEVPDRRPISRPVRKGVNL